MSSPCTPLSPLSRVAWRSAQCAVWLVGLAIFILLIVAPEWGIVAFWNVLIPVAPALLVFAPGVWRNVCPLGVTALLARHGGVSARRMLSTRARTWLNLAGVAALFLIVLWRRLELNTSGAATAAVLAGTALASVLMGLAFEWKSGWCSGLCPIHGVEKLYGSKPLVALANAHCDACQRCSSPCPDSTNAMHPLLAAPCWPQRIGEALLVGAFPGYVWGWFHVPDWTGATLTWRQFVEHYYPPLAGMLVTLALYLLVRSLIARRQELLLVRAFAAAAVSCYYWYRIPSLVGYGLFPDDGVLVNLAGTLPDWWVAVPRTATTALFVWWLVLHDAPRRHWADRPPLAESAGLCQIMPPTTIIPQEAMAPASSKCG